MGAPQLLYNPFLNASMHPTLANTIIMSTQPAGGLEKAKTNQEKKTDESLQLHRQSASTV